MTSAELRGVGQELTTALPCPEEVLQAHLGWRVSLAWHYEATSAVWRLEAPDGRRRFVKVRRRGVSPSLSNEAARLRWAETYVPVPTVLQSGQNAEVEWLVTAGLDGHDASTQHHGLDRAALIATFGRALRTFHEALPVGQCPFDSGIDRVLEAVQRRVAAGELEQGPFSYGDRQLDLAEALIVLGQDRPGQDDLVVCHGDYCFPNVMIGEEGAVTGYLDLGALGVASRWLDLAVGSWSTIWNLGSDCVPLFFNAYGIEPDEGLIAYYRLLYRLA